MMDLLAAVGRAAQGALKELSLESRGGESLPAFRVHIGALPGLREEPRREDFPLLLLRLLDFGDSVGKGKSTETESSTATVRILCGVWSEDDGSGGYHDVLNALARMRLHFLAHPLLEKKWRLTGKLEGSVFEEQAFPYWFGDLVTRWELRKPVEEFDVEEEIETYGSAYGNDQTRNWRHPGDAPDGVPEERTEK